MILDAGQERCGGEITGSLHGDVRVWAKETSATLPPDEEAVIAPTE